MVSLKNKKIVKNLEENLFRWGEYPAIFCSEEERERIKFRDYNSMNYNLRSTNLEDFFHREMKKLKKNSNPYNDLSYTLDTKQGVCLFLMREKGWILNDQETITLNNFLNSKKAKQVSVVSKPVYKKNYHENNSLLDLVMDLEDSFILNKDFIYNFDGIKYNRQEKEVALKYLNGLIEEFIYASEGGEGYEKNRGKDYALRVGILLDFKEKVSTETTEEKKERPVKIVTKEKKISLLELSTEFCEAIQKRGQNPSLIFDSKKIILYNHERSRLYFIDSDAQSDAQLDVIGHRRIGNFSVENSFWIRIRKVECLMGIRNSEKSFFNCVGKSEKKSFNGIIPSKCLLLWRS